MEDPPHLTLLLTGVADGGAPQGLSAGAALSPCPPQREVQFVGGGFSSILAF